MNLTKLIRGVFAGHTIYRILFHEQVNTHCARLSGDVLDLAGDGRAAYRTLLPVAAHITNLNVRGGAGEIAGDFNQPLPFSDAHFDAVLFFNAIYIADDQSALMQEISRILKPGGRLYIASPYISNEMRDPHDYLRLTSEGLERLALRSMMKVERIEPFGERFSSAAYLLNPLWFISPLRLVVYGIALSLDAIVPQTTRRRYPAPLGYFMVQIKSI